MKPFTKHLGIIAGIDRANVDTDQIIPKQFLKRIERTGFGEFLFFDWRQNEDGSLNREFSLNRPDTAGARILLARRNFGSGSSREHAVWALEDFGFRAVIAPSFADIFFNNCFKNGVLPIVLSESFVEQLFQKSSRGVYRLTVDLQAKRVFDESGFDATFEIDEFRRHCLMHGLDDIALTLQNEPAITAYEQQHGIGV